VRNADFDAAEAQLALVQQTWSDTHFAWIGDADPTGRFYFRVHGPRLLIEYDAVDPLASGGGHVHALTRDPVNDYGMDWLGLHYTEQAGGGGGGDGGGGTPGGGGTRTPTAP
jgi:Protein of unknown function (DUF3500)